MKSAEEKTDKKILTSSHEHKTDNSCISADKELAKLAQEVAVCQKCSLGSSRLNAVFGQGSSSADIMFIGEGPGYQEDHTGEPFVGRAGQLLDKILNAMTLSRKSVYIANIVKCHPMINPENPEMHSNDRPPTLEEITICRPYLEHQIKIIRPKYLVALGAVSARVLLDTKKSLTALRGQFHDFSADLFGESIKVIATYHPAALLRNPNWKKGAWDDMKMLMKEMGISSAQKKTAD